MDEKMLPEKYAQHSVSQPFLQFCLLSVAFLDIFSPIIPLLCNFNTTGILICVHKLWPFGGPQTIVIASIFHTLSKNPCVLSGAIGSQGRTWSSTLPLI